MSHDLYSSWATTEVARMIRLRPDLLMNPTPTSAVSVVANRESGRIWPIPDGRISVEINPEQYEIALELKRVNEGLHGILTAIGQSQAYLHKGYSGAAIVIPKSYDSYSNPGDYIAQVLANTNTNLSVGVFEYDTPDSINKSPFFDRISCIRPISLSAENYVKAGNFLNRQKPKTQWAHVREGSSEPHAFFKYLQVAKQLDLENPLEPSANLPVELRNAVNRIHYGINPIHYLSNSTGMSFHDHVWRNFWYKYILTSSVAKIWNRNSDGTYVVNEAPSELLLTDGTSKYFFSSRNDSIKNRLVEKLNASTITEDRVWEEFARGIHNRAHSYREDIDSGLEHMGFIESDGKPSDAGYKYVDSCERTNDCNSGKPLWILGSSLLKTGGMGAFLHYIYKVSEEQFSQDPLSFTTRSADGMVKFNQDEYLQFLRDQLANVLCVMNTSMIRGGAARKAFQGEFAILRKFNFISNFRIGVGLEINWPLVQEYMSFNI